MLLPHSANRADLSYMQTNFVTSIGNTNTGLLYIYSYSRTRLKAGPINSPITTGVVAVGNTPRQEFI